MARLDQGPVGPSPPVETIGQGDARRDGDVKALRDGVYEMREDFGKGWRMYFVQRGDVFVIMLGGGSKSGQQADIQAAVRLARTIKE